jgi:hypothetical protein
VSLCPWGGSSEKLRPGPDEHPTIATGRNANANPNAVTVGLNIAEISVKYCNVASLANPSILLPYPNRQNWGICLACLTRISLTTRKSDTGRLCGKMRRPGAACSVAARRLKSFGNTKDSIDE